MVMIQHGSLKTSALTSRTLTHPAVQTVSHASSLAGSGANTCYSERGTIHHGCNETEMQQQSVSQDLNQSKVISESLHCRRWQ